MATRWTYRILAALLMLITLAPAGSALTIEAGSDFYTTSGTFQLDLGLFGLPFGPVGLIGNPTGPGYTDTIVRRLDDAVVNGNGDTDIIDVELVELSLMSQSPLMVASSFYDIFISLDPTPPISNPNLGQMTIQLDDSVTQTGTMDSFFDVFVELRFVDTANPASQLVLSNFSPIHLTFNAPWGTTHPVELLTVAGPPGDLNANRHIGLPGDTVDLYVQDYFQVDWEGVGTQTLAPTVVPEPGTLSLMGLGLAGLWWRRRKHQP